MKRTFDSRKGVLHRPGFHPSEKQGPPLLARGVRTSQLQPRVLWGDDGVRIPRATQAPLLDGHNQVLPTLRVHWQLPARRFIRIAHLSPLPDALRHRGQVKQAVAEPPPLRTQRHREGTENLIDRATTARHLHGSGPQFFGAHGSGPRQRGLDQIQKLADCELAVGQTGSA